MSTREQDGGPEEPNPTFTLTQELHEFLAAALVEKFGDEIQVASAPDAENGLVEYRFAVRGATCTAAIHPLTGVFAEVSFRALLGRVHRGYTKALRWLAHNRAFHSAAIAYSASAARTKELWVASNRKTLSGDAPGIQLELAVFCVDVERALSGLQFWFPQLEDGVTIQQAVSADSTLSDTLTDPCAMKLEIEKCADEAQESPVARAYVTRWLCDWKQNLEILNSPAMKALACEMPALAEALPAARLRALRALRRHEDVLNHTLPILSASDSPSAKDAAIAAESLCELGREEDALALIQSAEFDEEPCIHFVRSYACIRLGRKEESEEHYELYTAMIGPDIIALEKHQPFIADED